jgi:outer membrane protein insertion porin family
MEGGIVTVAVSEGQVYRLGTMQVAGDRLPMPVQELAKLAPLQPGEPPSWRKVSQAASAMATALGKFGYLDASCEPDRDMDDANGKVNIVFAIRRGPQYTMGALQLNGLDPASEAHARSIWKLAPGAVLNLDYLQEFARVLMRDDKIRFKRFSMRHIPRQGRNVADIAFTFRAEETAAPRRR